MTPARIRPTTTSDFGALTRALVRVHRLDGYPVEGVSDPTAWFTLANPIGQWTALLDENPVGHIALMPPRPGDGAPPLLDAPDGDLAMVSRLFVSPSARGRSIAGKLLDVVEGYADKSGYTLALDVMSKDEAAIHLYTARGWAMLGEFEHSYGESQTIPAFAFVGPTPPSTRSRNSSPGASDL